MNRRKSWNKFLGNFHVYGGLFSVGFLIAFSYSAFVHQHHLKFPKPGNKSVYWEQSLNIPEIEDNHDYKLAVRDSLGLFGHTPWWEDYHDSLGVHHFMIARPAKQYWVTVPSKGNIFKINEIRTGFWDVLKQLHPLASGMQGHGKGPFFIKAWKYISIPMALVLFCVIMLAFYFWYKRSFKKPGSWILVGTIAVFPVLLFILIWLVG